MSGSNLDEILLSSGVSNSPPLVGPITDVALIPTTSAKQVAMTIMTLCIMAILTNLGVCYTIYKKRSLRNSSTAIIIGNLACVDILVTIKDIPMLLTVISTGRWYFEAGWCGNYGLTNVIYIIVSVSTLVTVTTDRYCRLKDKAVQQAALADKSGELDQSSSSSSKPSMLGYVIAHTTLSYSLSLLWSKYTFLTRKAFCRIEWPPRQAMSLTMMTSLIFIFPVSLLIYNALYGSFFQQEQKNESKGNNNSSDVVEESANEKKPSLEKTASTPDCTNTDSIDQAHMLRAEQLEQKAHSQLQISVGLFLLSWTPYVVESMVSGYREVSPTVGFITALVPIIATSLLPLMYMGTLCDERKQAILEKESGENISDKIAIITGV